jgi:hypothetical protein
MKPGTSPSKAERKGTGLQPRMITEADFTEGDFENEYEDDEFSPEALSPIGKKKVAEWAKTDTEVNKYMEDAKKKGINFPDED